MPSKATKVNGQQLAAELRAQTAGLKYVTDQEPGFGRRRCGRGFSYLTPTGKVLRNQRTRNRIEQLTIPPAWVDVWICRSSKGHLQSTGRDTAGRKQYLYHTAWSEVSNRTKFDRMAAMPKLLARIRRKVRKDLNQRDLTKERVCAAVVRVIDKGKVRVGNTEYAEKRGTRGATTLAPENVVTDGFQVTLDYTGKSGKHRDIEFNDRKIAAIIERCEEIAGHFLFCYRGADGKCYPVQSNDINDYLSKASQQVMTAKDFRTWWGSVTALDSLLESGPQETKRERKSAINRAITETAAVLGNTKAVSRQHYIHPELFDAYRQGSLADMVEDDTQKGITELTQSENRLASWLARSK